MMNTHKDVNISAKQHITGDHKYWNIQLADSFIHNCKVILVNSIRIVNELRREMNFALYIFFD